MTPLRDIAAAGICDRYYDLCGRYPLRIGVPIEKMPSKAVLTAAKGVVPISKLVGPGTGYRLGDLPGGLALDFIIQSRTTVEAYLSVPGLEGHNVDSFAILCHETKREMGAPLPNPPYPRPSVHSTDELISVFVELRAMAIEVYRIVNK